MSVRRDDKYIRYGQEYRLLKQEGFTPFDPTGYGFKLKSVNTACEKGYWCEYKVENYGIFLDKLYICCDDGNYPTVNGKTYDTKEDGTPVECEGCRVYSNIGLNLANSCDIVIGKDSIVDPGMHDAFLPYGYKTLREIIFKDGKNIHEINWDDEIERIRKIRNGDKHAKAYKKEHWWLNEK